MRLFFSGGEVQYHRKFLAENGISNVGFSYTGWRRTPYKGYKTWLLSDHFPDNQHIFLDSGGYSVNREGSEYTSQQLMELAEDYYEFAYHNLDRIDMFSEFDALALGKDWLEGYRPSNQSEDFNHKFVVIWHSEEGLDELDRLCHNYFRVGILKVDAFDRDLTPILNGMVKKYGTMFHGLGITSMDAMREIEWDSVGSTTWLAPIQWGETHVWTGRELKRYPKKYSDRARKQHRSLFTQNGFDAAKISDGDTNELLRLSVWSWQHFVDSIRPVVVTRQEKVTNTENSTKGILDVMTPAISDNNSLVLTGRQQACQSWVFLFIKTMNLTLKCHLCISVVTQCESVIVAF